LELVLECQLEQALLGVLGVLGVKGAVQALEKDLVLGLHLVLVLVWVR